MYVYDSLRSWRDFASECFRFGSEAVRSREREWRSRERIGEELGFSLAASPLAKPARDYGSSAARPLTNPASYASNVYEEYAYSF